MRQCTHPCRRADLPSQYTDQYDTVVSADESGFLEYWQPFEPYEPPKNVKGMWQLKSQTDLYEFKKVLTFPSMRIARQGSRTLRTGPFHTDIHYLLSQLGTLRHTLPP